MPSGDRGRKTPFCGPYVKLIYYGKIISYPIVLYNLEIYLASHSVATTLT